MGKYVNPGNKAFAVVAGDDTYVDKTGLIEFTNNRIGRMRPLICFSRPRRFGKSIAAHMLTTYYSKSCDSRELFNEYKISHADSFEKHFNKYNVIHINMVEYLIDSDSVEEMISEINNAILFKLINEFPDVRYYDTEYF